MRRATRAGVVTVAAAGAVLTASPAWAHDAPEGGDDGWVPIEELRPDYYEPFSGPACGTTVTIASGDVREVEARETVREDGSVLTEIRGDATVDITREDTGQVIDELDVSGEGYDLISADQRYFEIYLEGPSILLASLGPIDEAAFDAAGLPHLAYYKRGAVTIRSTGDPETGELLSEEIDVDAHRIHDLCTWFDGDRGDDRHDGKRW